jgi:hypothetical protein
VEIADGAQDPEPVEEIAPKIEIEKLRGSDSDRETPQVGFVNYICIIAYSSNGHGAQFLLCIQGS